MSFFQVDAFASEAFKGNPAAVVFVHGRQLTSLQMQAIAAENNLSETAFLEHSSPGELAEAAYFATSSEFNLRCAAVWLQQGGLPQLLRFSSAAMRHWQLLLPFSKAQGTHMLS
ncbi:hypothetical protein WJX84_008452 [Apatococcus fuscideae]|uniref:PhzF family phenazine biosynthesis protein n=1 Tax=Apatococcus fuscideae TaxID=2026836 RepID=A0AAW1TJG7_9CHLO